MDESSIARLLALVILLAGSAFFAGCDIALFSLTRYQISKLKEANGAFGRKVEELLARPQRLLVTIYIGNELINVAISTIATFIALEIFGELGVAIALGVGVFVLLIFGEIVPKAFAHSNNERWSLMAAYPLTIFMWIVWPVQVVVTWIATIIARIFGGGAAGAEGVMLSEDDLKSLMEESADEGIINEGEKEMIHNVFELGDVAATEVMTPRTDILAIELSTPLKDAWDEMAQSYFARAPVYDKTIDNIAGILFKKDFLKLDYPPPANMTLQSLLREPYIVPETIMIKELLNEFKSRKSHIAVVMDEYGGVQGVVTMDDILEELVGESQNGQNRNGDEVIRFGAGSFRVPASLRIDRFNELLGADIKHEDIETIGGFVFHLFGRAPRWGEKVESDGWKFIVEKVKGHRITELRVKEAAPNNDPVEKAEEVED